MKQASNRIIPQEVLSLILTTFNDEGESIRGTGKSSFITPLTKSLNKFLETNRQNIPQLYSKFNGNVSQSLIQRAFNFKSPVGATKELRNLLCYYSSNGKENWNEIVSKLFPDDYTLADNSEKITTTKTNRPVVEVLRRLTELESTMNLEVRQVGDITERVMMIDGEKCWTREVHSVVKITSNQTLLSVMREDNTPIDSESFCFFFKTLLDLNININFMHNSEIAFTVCIDRQPERMEQLCDKLRTIFSPRYNEQVFLVRIRNWNDLLLNQLRFNHIVLFEMKTKRTTELVLTEQSR